MRIAGCSYRAHNKKIASHKLPAAKRTNNSEQAPAERNRLVKFDLSNNNTHFIARYDQKVRLQNTPINPMDIPSVTPLTPPDNPLQAAMDRLADAFEEIDQTSHLAREIKADLENSARTKQGHFKIQAFANAWKNDKLESFITTHFQSVLSQFTEVEPSAVEKLLTSITDSAIDLAKAAMESNRHPPKGLRTAESKIVVAFLESIGFNQHSLLTLECAELIETIIENTYIEHPDQPEIYVDMLKKELTFVCEQYSVESMNNAIVEASFALGELMAALENFKSEFKASLSQEERLRGEAWMAELETEGSMEWLTGRYFGEQAPVAHQERQAALSSLSEQISDAHSLLYRHKLTHTFFKQT